MAPSMPQPTEVTIAPRPIAPSRQSFLRKLLGRPNRSTSSSPAPPDSGDERLQTPDDISKTGLIKRMSRRVVPSLSGQQTLNRQQSERREYLAPIEPTADERRAVSVDRRSHMIGGRAISLARAGARASAPSFVGESRPEAASLPKLEPIRSIVAIDDELPEEFGDMSPSVGVERRFFDCPAVDEESMTDVHSITGSEYEAMIRHELENIWILNLSMHFRDRSKREKFFVTYREHEHLWRRVTVSLDYRDAPPDSLEHDLLEIKYQRDKSAKIYESIRDSLPDIQFYDTVTNLKLETTDGRLHVHVVEDGNEIIHHPTVNQIRHLGCRRIKESDITFDSHMSGFVYKVNLKGQTFIKKEIPSPDTVDEFLYEVNALHSLRYSKNVIRFHGVVVDDFDEYVKGLLISYADQGALIDVLYENKDKDIGLSWSTREKWARQIVQGLADIHESGFVQGDFTLSNIVIDVNGDAKIIDINRRGCPVGWEPPEATALIETNQRLSMYIGVKSDLYQLGMVLWAIAMMEDEPEAQGRPLMLGPQLSIPDWYRQITEICLSDDPRFRLQASSLLQLFPRMDTDDDIDDDNDELDTMHEIIAPISVNGSPILHDYVVDGYDTHSIPVMRTVQSSNGWSQSNTTYVDNEPVTYDPFYYTRGRSPPSPLPSNYEGYDSEGNLFYKSAWAANRNIAPSYSDSGEEEEDNDDNDDDDDCSDEEFEDAVENDEDYERNEQVSLVREDEVIRESTPTPPAEKPLDTCVKIESASEIPRAVIREDKAMDINEVEAETEAEKSSMQTSMLTIRSDEASDGLQEAIQVKIVNLGSSKNLSIVETEVSARIKSPERLERLSQNCDIPVLKPLNKNDATRDEIEHRSSSLSAQKPRTVEEVSMERPYGGQDDDVSLPDTQEDLAKEHESETEEPEYTTQPWEAATPDDEDIRDPIRNSAMKTTSKIDSSDDCSEDETQTDDSDTNSAQKYEYFGPSTLPATLTGVGANHERTTGDFIHEKATIDDDIRTMTRPEAPMNIITTEASI